jgi:hypothetical protein
VVSQTLDSLLSNFTTILLIGLGVAVVVAVSVLFLVTRRRRKSKPSAMSLVGPPT